MSIETIHMPSLGESVTEASIAQWLISEGDKIKKYDPIAEAVSDKVTTEIPSNYSGTIKELLVELDTDIEIGTPILTIETEGSGESSESQEGERTEEFMSHINEELDKEAEEESNEVKTEAIAKEEGQEEESEAKKVRYSPAVVRIAQERGIDLQQIGGTGKHGRITRKDVEQFDVSQQGEKAEAEEVKRTETKQSPKRTVAQGNKEVVPADGVRKAIAKKMVQSTSEIPHAWLTVEADVTNIVKLRNEMKSQFKEQEGLTLSYFPFFIKAVVQALKKHPIMNASWDNGNIIYYKDINISVAVATDEHLYVPVIHQADDYSVSGLAKQINHLAEKARSKKLENKDMQNGTITVNNTGSFGSIQSMGIINHPQAAILQVESIKKAFVPTDDNNFKVADMVNLSLSIDHRMIDGLQAGRFLKDVKENLARLTDESDIY